MKIKGWDLDFFNSGEWQVCDERLKDLERQSRAIGLDGYNPGRKGLFEALRATSQAQTRVVILGQDPYPEKRFASGLAFSVPPGVEIPTTLSAIFDEYQRDLHHPRPTTGCLDRWTGDGGVLLWNAFPSCRTGHSLSHDWLEWEFLTKEIIEKLSKKGIVYALLGNVARYYSRYISPSNNHIIQCSHPSPRGSRSSNSPFNGSRLFSTINDRLNDLALPPVDWKLP